MKQPLLISTWHETQIQVFLLDRSVWWNVSVFGEGRVIKESVHVLLFSVRLLGHCGISLNSPALHCGHIWAGLPLLPTKCLNETCSACRAAFRLPVPAAALTASKLINNIINLFRKKLHEGFCFRRRCRAALCVFPNVFYDPPLR